MERAKTLLAYYKGEISLEDIKSAGEKLKAEAERRTAVLERLKNLTKEVKDE